MNEWFALIRRLIDIPSVTGEELQPVLVDHLLSDDFFFVSLFPKAVFTIQTARQVPDPILSAPNYMVDGRLELRGITKDLQFAATVNRLGYGSDRRD